MAYQRLEHGELARGEGQFLAVFVQRSQTHVERERPEGDDFLVYRRRARHFCGRAAAQHGMDACQQLPGVEGFGQIVVRTDFQADDAIHVFAFGREHDDGRLVVGCAKPAANGQAVFARHHQVQHDQVDRIAQHDPVECFAVFGKDHLEPFLGEVAA